MADLVEGGKYMQYLVQNTQDLLCPTDQTVLPNWLVNISIESLEALRQEECL